MTYTEFKNDVLDIEHLIQFLSKSYLHGNVRPSQFELEDNDSIDESLARLVKLQQACEKKITPKEKNYSRMAIRETLLAANLVKQD